MVKSHSGNFSLVSLIGSGSMLMNRCIKRSYTADPKNASS